MWWGAAIQGITALFGASNSRKAGRNAEEIAFRNERAARAESNEQLRRMADQFKQIEGTTEAIAAGSGFSQTQTGSQQTYLRSMIKEHGQQLTYEERAARRREGIIRKGGQVAQDAARSQSVANIGSAIGNFGQAWSLFSG